MEIKVLAEGVDGHDDARQTVRQSERCPHILDQAVVRDEAEVLEQDAVESEIRPQHFGDAQGKVTMRDGIEDCLGQQRPKKLDFLLVA